MPCFEQRLERNRTAMQVTDVRSAIEQQRKNTPRQPTHGPNAAFNVGDPAGTRSVSNTHFAIWPFEYDTLATIRKGIWIILSYFFCFSFASKAANSVAFIPNREFPADTHMASVVCVGCVWYHGAECAHKSFKNLALGQGMLAKQQQEKEDCPKARF